MPVYKNENRKSKDGRKWYFKCQYTDALGNKKTKVSKMFATRDEATKEEAKFKVRSNDIPINNTTTIYDVYEAYFFLDKFVNKESSLYSKESRIRVHVLPFFKTNNSYMRISSITPDLINKWKSWIDSFNYSLATKQANYHALSSLIRYAVNKYKLPSNPLLYTKNFTETTDKVVEKEAVRFITKEEYNLFIKNVDSKYKCLFHFLYEVGCRRGELQAITWDDVNFSNGQIRINKTLATHNISNQIKITNTKNKKIRYVDISNSLLNDLKKEHDVYSRLDGFSNRWFVFGGIRYIPSSTLTRIKDKTFDDLISEGYNINKITIHEFRHSSASYMISNGIPAEIIAYRLGDTVETIRKIYAHLFPDTQKNTRDLFENL